MTAIGGLTQGPNTWAKISICTEVPRLSSCWCCCIGSPCYRRSRYAGRVVCRQLHYGSNCSVKHLNMPGVRKPIRLHQRSRVQSDYDTCTSQNSSTVLSTFWPSCLPSTSLRLQLQRQASQYAWSSEANTAGINEVEFNLTMVPVQARIHPLKFPTQFLMTLGKTSHLGR